MKALITTIGICGLLFAPLGAYAATAYTWSGGASSAWNVSANWDDTGDLEFPGYGSGDTAMIAEETRANPFFLAATLANDVVSVTLDARHANVSGSLEFELRLNGSITITDSMSLYGDDDANQHATFQARNGTVSFSTAGLNLYGEDPDAGSHGQARFYLEENGTVSAPDEMIMQGDVAVRLEQTLNWSTTDMIVRPDTVDNFRTDVIVTATDADEVFTVDSVVVGGATYPCKLTFTGLGSLVTN